MCGVNVSCYIVCSLQYFVEAGAMAVRRCKKADLKRIAKATGAAFLTSLSNMEGAYESVPCLAQWHSAGTPVDCAYQSVVCIAQCC